MSTEDNMNTHPEDHDLLIRMDEKVGTLVKSVGLLTDDHERRIRFLERYAWGLTAAIGLGATLIGWYILSHPL